MSWYQKGKTNLDFTEARDSEWQWHQLGHMQVPSSLQTDNHASTPPLCFLQTGCPSCLPTNSVKALKAKALKAHRHLGNMNITPFILLSSFFSRMLQTPSLLFFAYRRCPHSMRNRVCVTVERPYVCLSVCSVDRQQQRRPAGLLLNAPQKRYIDR